MQIESIDNKGTVEAQIENTNQIQIVTEINTPKLTKLQRERKNALVYMCGEDHAIAIVQRLTSQGLSSWAAVQPKFSFVYTKDAKHNQYVSALYDVFDTDVDYTFDEIIQKVTEARQNLTMDPYTDLIHVKCVGDFVNLFIVKQVTEVSATTHNKVIGYRGVYRIKPE